MTIYDSTEEVNQKLAGCVLLYKLQPLYVHGAAPVDTPPWKIKVSYCNDLNNVFYISLDDADLNYREVGDKLGYMNLKGYIGRPYNECTYLMRMPIRSSSYAQGLSKKNVRLSDLKGNRAIGLGRIDLIFDQAIYGGKSSELKLMMNNVYPTIKEVSDDFFKDETLVSKAFHRMWAIEKDEVGPFNLLYKNTKVGWTEDFNRFKVSDRYRFLKKEFEKVKERA